MRNYFSALNREFDKRNYLHTRTLCVKNIIPSAKSFGSNHIKNSFLFLTTMPSADVFLGVTKLSPFHTTSLVFRLYLIITARCKTHDLKVETQAITYLFVFTMLRSTYFPIRVYVASPGDKDYPGRYYFYWTTSIRLSTLMLSISSTNVNFS